MAEERARVAAKGWLTRTSAKMESLLARSDSGSADWRLEAAIVQAEFLKRLDAFDEAQLAVEGTVDLDKLSEDIEKSAVFRDSFTGLRARFEKCLTAPVNPDPASSAVARLARMKLPDLMLPTFDGDIRCWSLFWESFSTCVDETDLPDVSKL